MINSKNIFNLISVFNWIKHSRMREIFLAETNKSFKISSKRKKSCLKKRKRKRKERMAKMHIGIGAWF